MTRDEAIGLAETKWWEGMLLKEAAILQLHEEKLCMPFDKFHEGIEIALGRPVWTHEFAKPALLKEELEGVTSAPRSPFESLGEVLDTDR